MNPPPLEPFPFAEVVATMRVGLKSLLLHKLRAALTMLGIIFGVCSVIAMLAIGEGASYEAQEAIKKLGSNNIILRRLKPPDSAPPNGSTRTMALDYGLLYHDVDRLRETIPAVQQVLPMRLIRETALFDRNVVSCQVVGTMPSYAAIVGVDVVRGRFLAESDVINQDNVCVLSVGLAAQLFPFQDPLEHTVKVSEFYYRVVGLVRERNLPAHRGDTGRGDGEPLDQNLYLPLSTTRTRFGEVIMRRAAGSFSMEKVELHQITVQMRDTGDVEVAEPQIKALLQRFHPQGDFEMIVPLQLLRQAEQTKRMFNIVLGSIAAISLLVGGIGIMNIMLATVTERTREIGIRRALGARRRDITLQFLMETLLLSIGGGLIGVALGLVIPVVVTQLTAMRTIVTWWSVVVAFGISALVGIVFGLYPARAAAALDPIEALRHE